jgi:zinc transport system ATP-binding protein
MVVNNPVSSCLSMINYCVISTYVKTIACLNRTLYYHQDKLITPEMIQKTYQCPID